MHRHTNTGSSSRPYASASASASAAAATPAAKSEFSTKLRQRNRGSCIVKPFFVGAIESGDAGQLAQYTEDYFESIAEGKLSEERVLGELDSLSAAAESSVRSSSALLRRLGDLSDFIEAEKAKLGVMASREQRDAALSKSKFLTTPKKLL